MKKVLVCFLVVLLALQTLTACNKKQGTDATGGNTSTTASKVKADGFPIVDEPITITMSSPKSALNCDFKDMITFKEYEKKTNVHIEWQLIDSTAYTEKRNLMFASGDLPEAMFTAGLSQSDIVKYGQQGLLMPMNNLIDKYAPNIKKMITARADIKKAITTPDGNIYTLFSGQETYRSPVALRPWINKKWLDKLGLKVPTTTDEFYNVLKAFKEKDPNGNGKQDEIPLTLQSITPGSAGISSFDSFFAAWGVMSNKHYVDKQDKVVIGGTQDSYKDALKYMNKLYKEKLLDQEVFTQDGKQLIAKGNEKDTVLGAFTYAAAFMLVGNDRDKDYTAFPALKGPNGDQYYPASNPVGVGKFAITSKAKNPEAIMRWIDYFYSDEGSLFFTYGPKDVGYKVNADGTWLKYTPEGKNAEEYRGQNTPAAGVGIPSFLPKSVMEKEVSEYNNYLEGQLKTNVAPYTRVPYPSVYMTDEQEKKVSAIRTDVYTYIDQMMVKFITGETDIDSGWNNYITTLKNMRVEEVQKEYQAAYDSYKKNK